MSIRWGVGLALMVLLCSCSAHAAGLSIPVTTGVTMIVLGIALVMFVALEDYDELSVEPEDDIEPPVTDVMMRALLAGIILIVVGIGTLLAWAVAGVMLDAM